MSTLRERCKDLEVRSRHCNVRIMGVKEGREDDERMSNFVARLLKEALVLNKPPLLDRAHQSLRSKPTADNRLITTVAGDKISVLLYAGGYTTIRRR